jgi:ArsR family transcriptional regulator
MKSLRSSTHGLDESTKTLKAFADPVRLRLLSLLSNDREVCVCHLHVALALPQPTVSRHLAYLRRCGILAARKEGQWVYYRLARSRPALSRILLGCLGSCLGDPLSFATDQERLDRTISCCDGDN